MIIFHMISINSIVINITYKITTTDKDFGQANKREYYQKITVKVDVVAGPAQSEEKARSILCQGITQSTGPSNQLLLIELKSIASRVGTDKSRRLYDTVLRWEQPCTAQRSSTPTPHFLPWLKNKLGSS